MSQENISTHAIRLLPGEDLKESIDKFVREKNLKAGWVVTCAGSLTDFLIRFANQPPGSSGSGHFEIVNLTGTLSMDGLHLHISISDSTGKTTGGHLMSGCKIYIQQQKSFCGRRIGMSLQGRKTAQQNGKSCR